MKRRRRDRGRRVPSEQSPNLRTRDSSPEAASDRRKNWPVLAYCVILAATAIAAYCRTLHFPLFFDDFLAIRDNLSIRHLKDLGAVLSPPLSLAEESGVSGRPLVNLSFAINYAFGGLNPWGFRVTNVVIHLAAGLALFGILRRTLERVGPGDPTTRFPLDSPSAADRIGHLRDTAHGNFDGALLSFDALFVHSVCWRECGPTRLGSAGDPILPPRHGGKGGHGNCPYNRLPI